MCKERSAVLSLSAFRSLACACTHSFTRTPEFDSNERRCGGYSESGLLKIFAILQHKLVLLLFSTKIPNAAQVNLSTKMATSQPTTGPHCTQRRKVKKGEMSQRHDRKRIDSEQGRICTCGTLRQRDSISRRVASFVGTVLSFVTRWSFFNNFGCSIG